MFNISEHSEGCYVICFELRVPSATGCCDWCHVYVQKNTLVGTGVIPLKEIITVYRFVRFMNHRSLKPEIFPTPVHEPHCFQHIYGEFHSASIGVSDGIASSHRRLSQPVPLPTRVLLLSIELLNMAAFRLDCPLFFMFCWPCILLQS